MSDYSDPDFRSDFEHGVPVIEYDESWDEERDLWQEDGHSFNNFSAAMEYIDIGGDYDLPIILHWVDEDTGEEIFTVFYPENS